MNALESKYFPKLFHARGAEYAKFLAKSRTVDLSIYGVITSRGCCIARVDGAAQQ